MRQDGKANVGVGMAAVANQCRVACLALQRKRYDIAIGRRDDFEPPYQRLLAFARTPRFLEKATARGDYVGSGLGHITYNSR